MTPTRRRWYFIGAVAAVLVLLTPSYLRAYRVAGPSDAPSYLTGDLILVNRAAYDLRIPYTSIVLLSHSEPQLGDVVQFTSPGDGILVFKRIVGRPGDSLSMEGNHLVVNGEPLEYVAQDPAPYADVAARHGLGSVVELERLGRIRHVISYTPGESEQGRFDLFVVPEGRYFVMGDNRDNSRDSRMYGPVDRAWILGRVGQPIR